MIKFASLFVAVSLAMAAPVTASAQEAVNATLRVENGNVMTSQGGEFATAQSGQVVATGNRLMVAENSAATVIFSATCQRQYTSPGVYTIQRVCEPGVARVGTDWVSAGKIALGVGVGAAILANMEESGGPPPQPVSQ